MSRLDVVRPWGAALAASSLPFALAYAAAGQPMYWSLVPGAFCVLGVLAHRWVVRWQDARGFDEALAQHWLTTHHDDPPRWVPDVGPVEVEVRYMSDGLVYDGQNWIPAPHEGTARMNADIRADERRRRGL